MLFLSLIIIIRSPVMHFSQIWPPSTVLGAIFGSGYVLGHFGGQICRFWFRLNFSNFFQLFCNEIVKLGTFFNNLARNGDILVVCDFALVFALAHFWPIFAFFGHFGPNYRKMYLTLLFHCKKVERNWKNWAETKNDNFDPQNALKPTQTQK